MAYEQRDNSGSSFKNKRKRDGKKDPDLTGTIVVEGVEFWLDTWIKNRRVMDDGSPNPDFDSGKPTWFSHSLRPKEQSKNVSKKVARPAARPSAPPPPPGAPSAAKDAEAVKDADGNYTWK